MEKLGHAVMGHPKMEGPVNATELAERLAMLSRGQRRAFDMIRSGDGAKVSRQMTTVLLDLGLVERFEYPETFATSGEAAGHFVTGLASIWLHKLAEE
jgi:hypothetical protein